MEQEKKRLFVWAAPDETNTDYQICVHASDKTEAMTKLFDLFTGTLGMPGIVFAKTVRDTWTCAVKHDHHNRGVFFI